MVAPLVFYTGDRKWDALTNTPHKWRNLPTVLRPFAITLNPVFFNLQATADTKLRSKAGLLAPVLHLIRHRRARRREFEEFLRRAVSKFELFKTAADEMHEEITRSILLAQIKERFPDTVSEVSVVKATNELATLKEWTLRIVTAESLDDVGIKAPK